MTPDNNSKVAVVVVHGVAYHAPGASARAASELLHGLRPKGKESPYGPDTQETVSIPLKQLKIVSPLPVSEPEWINKIPILGYFAGVLQERTMFLTRAWRTKRVSDEPSNEKVANDFMRLLLQDYRGVDRPAEGPDAHDEAASYVTTRIRMVRGGTSADVEDAAKGASAGGAKPPEGTPASGSAKGQTKTEVDIYECYWADLSRPKNTILSFFQALYQLLFHLGSLSRLAISTGADAPENRDRKIWKRLDWTQLWAVRILTLPIPILNLILFVSLVGAIPHLISEEWVKRVAVLTAAILGVLVCAITSRWLPATPWPLTWAAIPLAFAAAFAGIACLLLHFVSQWSLLALEGWNLGAGVVYLSIRVYDEVRDGAKEVAWALYGVFLAVFIGILIYVRFHGDHKIPLEQATLWMIQIVLAALRASWILLIITAFVALILGSRAWRSLPHRNAGEREARARAKAAIRTSRFALALPTLGVLIVTLALWSGLFVKSTNQSKCAACPTVTLATKLFCEKIPNTLSCEKISNTFDVPDQLSWLVPKRSVILDYADEPKPSESPDTFFRGIFVWGATPAFPIVLATMLIGVFLLLLWLIPSILTEMKPPRGSDNDSSRRMGAWLSRGLDSTVVVILLMWVAAFALPVLFATLRHWPDIWPHIKFESLDYPTAWILQWLGLASGSLAILASLAKSGSSALGIILDVDNYLRTSPEDGTPRARIAERYYSLLRYLAGDKDQERKYDRIVILAHSLGALISGDLLLYLKSQGDPELARLGLGTPGASVGTKIPILLFTMGDPLRQFLNRFFPYLYEWVRNTPDNSLQHLGGLEETRPGSPPLAGTPDPRRLGVERWVNAYRSGDYIGRSLWLNEWYGRTTAGTGEYPQAISVAQDNATPPTREEMCIGAGAHQHYWDQSAPDIAEKLDELIG